jgi:hypothetical protein
MSAESDAEGDKESRARLDAVMTERAEELDLLWNKVAERAGMTYANLHKIRTGAISITNRAKRGIERALQWQKGSVDAILAGRDPKPIQMDKPPLTERQQALKLSYLANVRDLGPDEAFRILLEDIARLNAEEVRQGQTDEHIDVT